MQKQEIILIIIKLFITEDKSEYSQRSCADAPSRSDGQTEDECTKEVAAAAAASGGGRMCVPAVLYRC